MKKAIFFILIISLIIISCAKQKGEFLLDGWKMVKMERIDEGKVTNYLSDRYTIDFYKMWSETQFMFVGKYKVDTTITYRYGTGTYTLEGTRYEENILYHYDKSYEGAKIKMLLEYKNDTLFQIWPVNENGQPNEISYYIEKYVRLK